MNMVAAAVADSRHDKRLFQTPAALLCLGLWLGLVQCAGFHNPNSTETSWTRTTAGTFIYKDRWIKLVFVPREGPFFDWAFYNLTRRTVEIPGQALALFRMDDPTPYTLWGKAVGKGPKPGTIFIRPKGFVKFSYPIQVNSPFFPFRAEQQPRLRIQVKIGAESRSYLLFFPPDS